MIGVVHVALGVAAILAGGWIFLARKGTRAHVRVGWAYVACMVGVNVTALCIYRLTRGPNLFHGLAVASLAMTVVGVAQPLYRTRFRRWMWRHYQYMCWSYVGLLTATVNEAAVRVPVLRQFTAARLHALPVFASAFVVAAGAIAIFANQRRVLASVRPAPRKASDPDAAENRLPAK
jgi:uncharacterized membrane protein